jgi:hypothetical protein
MICEVENMSFFKRFSTYSAPQSSAADQPNRKTTWLSAREFGRPTILVAIVGVILYMPLGSDVLAKSGAQADAKEDTSSVDPDAIAAVKKMSAYLHTLKSYQIIDDVTQDDVLDDGLIVQSTSKVDYLLARPDRMRIEVTSDERHRLYLYDGKNFTVWARQGNYYATVPAPPTIGQLFEDATNKYDIEIPLYDLYNWGNKDEDINKIKTAVDIGPSAVNGVTCEHYAFHQEGVDWQLWIQLGEFPLPRKLVITTLTDDARPQHSDTLTWNLAPSFNDGAFAFDPPPDAKRVLLEGENASATEKAK